MKVIQALVMIAFILMQTAGAVAQTKDTLLYWNAPYCFGLRTAVGYSTSFYAELGLSYHKANTDVVKPAAMCFYTSAEWFPTILPVKEVNVYAFKAGFELTGHLQVGAIEIKYQSDFLNRHDFVITPKLGLGLFGSINILYGYNFSTNKYPFNEETGKHQISLVFNIDRILIKRH